MGQNPFPFIFPRHPAGEALPIAGEDFLYQVRACASVPGKTDGLYACLPLSGGGYEWVPWLGAFDPLVVTNLHVLGDADIDNDLNVDGDAQIDGSLSVDTNLTIDGSITLTSLAGGGSQSVLVDNSGVLSAGSGAPSPGTIDILDGGVSGASAVGIVNFTPAASWAVTESPSGTGVVAPNFGTATNTFLEGTHAAITSGVHGISTFGAQIVDDANAAAVISTLGLDADIATLALPASTTISTFGASLIDDANAAAALTTLGITQYTDEMAQDAVGTILTDSSTIDFTYNDAGGTITAIVKAESIPLGDLSNVTTAGAADGDYLGYDSGIPGWEPQPLPDIVTTVESTNWIYQQEGGTFGTGNGQFDGLRGLAVDSGGNIIVADTGNNRIQKLDSSLAYVDKEGTAGDGDGEFADDNGAWAVAVTASDEAWVVDRGNHRLQKFNSSLVYQSQIDGTVASSAWVVTPYIGGSGSGAGQFNAPLSVAKDSGGNYYVADFNNQRVQKFNSSWVHQASFSTAGYYARDIAIDSSDRVFVLVSNQSSPFAFSVRQFNTSGTLQQTSTSISASDSPSSIAVSASTLWVVASGADHVKAFTSTSLSAGPVGTFGSTGSGNGQFSVPHGIAWDGTYLYVTDVNNSRVQKFNSSGTYQTQWGTLGSGASNYNSPRAIAVIPGGNILVSDRLNNRLSITTNTGTPIEAIAFSGAFYRPLADSTTLIWMPNTSTNYIDEVEYVTGQVPGSGNGNFNTPSGIDIDRAPGTIFVVDQGNNRIQYFDSSGAYVGQWGSLGTGNNNFNTPTDCAVNQSTGDVYVVDQGNRRVSQFTSTGTFIRSWGGTGYADGQFDTPYSIDINDDTSNVFVTDIVRDDVQEFSASGVFIRKFGQRGVESGEYDLAYGLAINQAGDHLYITDAAANRVQDFEEETSTQIAQSVAFDLDTLSVSEIVPGRTFIGVKPLPLDGLYDVAIGPVWGVSPAAGQVVTYDEAQAQWTNKALADLGLTLDNLSDVAITTPATGQVPVYNATTQQWENAYPGLIRIGGTTFTTSTGFIVDDCFTTTYRKYLLIVTVDDATSAGGLNLYMRDTTPATVVTGYERAALAVSSSASTVAGSSVTGGTTGWGLMTLINGAVDGTSFVEIVSPRQADKVHGVINTSSLTVATTTYQWISGGIGLRATTACAGFVVQPGAGNVSGRWALYAYPD